MPSYRAKNITDPLEQARREIETRHFGTENGQHADILKLRQVVPFDMFAIAGLDYPGLGAGKGAILASDMPEDFLKAYCTTNGFQLDPLRLRISPEKPGVSWHELTLAERRDPTIAPLVKMFDRYGIKTRTVVGFYRGGTIYGSATFTRDAPFDDKEMFVLEAAARMIHAALSENCLRHMSDWAGLSAGELACLQAVADGLSTQELAVKLNYTEDTVASYIKTATKKLGARNRSHALAEGMRRRIIR